MRVQSINQNNYQNNRPKNDIGFKMNFCIKVKPLGCPKNLPCDEFIRAMRTKTEAVVMQCQSKSRVRGEGIPTLLPPFIDSKFNSITLAFDEATLAEMELKANQEASNAIFYGVHSGQNSEIIEIDSQAICDGIPCDYRRLSLQ